MPTTCPERSRRGNRSRRVIADVTNVFTYETENRLTSITGVGVTATFLYDADGQRVKGTVNGVTTVYIAGVHEWQNGATTLYYEGNALRRTGYASDNGVFYLLRDHLKSSSALVNQNGTLHSWNYFFPFGGNRGRTAFSELTTKRFTGQYHESALPGGEGLSYYGARWYDAQLGRFLSADTIVPGPANPQAFNRYSYVLNSPTGLVDPSGHDPEDACGSNPVCWFFAIRWQDANDTTGLRGDWLRLKNDVWWSEDRPSDLGAWSTVDANGEESGVFLIDAVTISGTDSPYNEDLMSRPFYQHNVAKFKSDVSGKYGEGNLPEVGFAPDPYRFGFALQDSATAGQYNAVEWYLGSFSMSFTVTAVNARTQTASVQVTVVNDSGWESATRFPQRFVDYLGTSILPNRGGQPTPHARMGALLLLVPQIRDMWSMYGVTYRQTFTWNTTIRFGESPGGRSIRSPGSLRPE